MPIRQSFVVVINFSTERMISQKRLNNFLAPPAERQQSFSNAELSVCLSLSVRPSVGQD